MNADFLLYARIDALEACETGRGASEDRVRERTVREGLIMSMGEGRISCDVTAVFGITLTRCRWLAERNVGLPREFGPALGYPRGNVRSRSRRA